MRFFFKLSQLNINLLDFSYLRFSSNINVMLKKLAFVFTLILTFMSNQSIYSQDFSEISSLNLRELTDPQIDLLLRRAGAQGYNEFDILKIAQSQGFTLEEIEKLDKRFKSAKNVNRIAETATTPLEETRLRKQWLQDIEVFREIDSDVFGYNVFRGTSFLSFQSNLNLPTPPDYILGPGDKLFIDIYGESEAYYQVEISPELEAGPPPVPKTKGTLTVAFGRFNPPHIGHLQLMDTAAAAAACSKKALSAAAFAAVSSACAAFLVPLPSLLFCSSTQPDNGSVDG